MCCLQCKEYIIQTAYGQTLSAAIDQIDYDLDHSVSFQDTSDIV